MLPPQPPALSNGDFDPSQPLEDEDAEMQEEEQEGPNVQLSSVEINILIYLVSGISCRVCVDPHAIQLTV